MKTKYIFIIILVSMFYVPIYAGTYTVDQNYTISLTTGYVNDMNETWNVISTVTDKPLKITYTIGTESGYDFVTIKSVDDQGNPTSLLTLSGGRSGSISTMIPNGKAQITFTSDGSASNEDEPGTFAVINISFAVDNDEIITNNLHVTGNIQTDGIQTIKGYLGIGTTVPSKKLEISEGIGGRFTFSASNCTSGYEIAQTIDNTGYKLNIGTTVRDYRIAINGSDKFTITNAGIVGIGTTSPMTSAKLDVNGKLRVSGDIYGSNVLTFADDARFNITSATVPTLRTSPFSMPQYGIAAALTIGSAELWMSGNSGIRMFTAGNAIPRLSILTNGFVGIGTITPDALLTVNGTIHAKEVNVTVDIPADYVFDSTYKLMSLPEVEQFVKVNSHLPQIPSAAEVSKNGMNMGEMQNKLLQKIEELTLYMIEQQKEINQLKASLNPSKGGK